MNYSNLKNVPFQKKTVKQFNDSTIKHRQQRIFTNTIMKTSEIIFRICGFKGDSIYEKTYRYYPSISKQKGSC